MGCEHIRIQLGAYLDDELSQAGRCEVEAHLAVCPACAAELDSLGKVAGAIAPHEQIAVPERLWGAIQQRLDSETSDEPFRKPQRARFRLFRGPIAAAASVVLAVGVGLVALTLLQETTPQASASTVDFSVLLDALPLDAQKAFHKFLTLYNAREIQPYTAHTRAPDLDFEIPETLPGGFHREQVYVLRFGDAPGIAAEYRRDDGEFLAALFHPPVKQEDYGTHKDRPCIVGKHRGHTVEVGPWRLVHVTDPSTCHCLLSRLDLEREVPAIMAAIAPRSKHLGHLGHGGADQNHPPQESP